MSQLKKRGFVAQFFFLNLVSIYIYTSFRKILKMQNTKRKCENLITSMAVLLILAIILLIVYKATNEDNFEGTLKVPAAQNKTVLVLNSDWDGNWNRALLIDSKGRQEVLSCFSQDDKSEAYSSCSVIWNNQMYIYGGLNNVRQISKLNQYRLQRVGELPFDFSGGACTNMAGRKLFLCFDSLNNIKQCYWSANPLADFHEVQQASYAHSQTRISSSECKLLNFSQYKKLKCKIAIYFY